MTDSYESTAENPISSTPVDIQLSTANHKSKASTNLNSCYGVLY